MATVVIRHCCSHSFSRCRSWVNVSKLRTGLRSRSCGTATKISVAPTSIPAALGSMQLRLGTAPPWPARFCFFLLLSRFMLFSPRSRSGPSRLLSGNLLIGIAAVQHNRVTTVSITKLGTKLKNGLEAPLRSRSTSHHHDGYEHTSCHTLFAAPYTPPVHSSFNPLKAGPWLRMTRLRLHGERVGIECAPRQNSSGKPTAPPVS